MKPRLHLTAWERAWIRAWRNVVIVAMLAELIARGHL